MFMNIYCKTSLVKKLLHLLAVNVFTTLALIFLSFGVICSIDVYLGWWNSWFLILRVSLMYTFLKSKNRLYLTHWAAFLRGQNAHLLLRSCKVNQAKMIICHTFRKNRRAKSALRAAIPGIAGFVILYKYTARAHSWPWYMLL